MPKSSPVTQKHTQGKGAKSKKKSSSARRRPLPTVSKQAAEIRATPPQAVKQAITSVKATPHVASASRPSPVAPSYPQLFAELKRIGIIAGPMIFLLIVLALVL
jgi:hypothetical protein